MTLDRIWTIINVLVIEKIIQHTVVTLAFVLDVASIRNDVAVPYEFLMISGMFVGVFFAMSLWGMLKHRTWAPKLITALALFDFLGEFVAQGTLMIMCTVSFLVAFVLLILSISYRRQVAASPLPA